MTDPMTTAPRVLTPEELDAQRTVAELVAKTAPLDRYRLNLEAVYADDVLNLLATITDLQSRLAEREAGGAALPDPDKILDAIALGTADYCHIPGDEENWRQHRAGCRVALQYVMQELSTKPSRDGEERT